MTIIDFAAIAGAFAWLPQIWIFIKRILSLPKISIIIQRFSEIGFTPLGPIFNIRLAFSVDNKDIVIKNIQIKIRHESGEERLFSWQGIVQNLGKLSGPEGQFIPYEKENTVLAIKLKTEDIDERFIRFQEELFLKKRYDLINELNKKLFFIKSQPDYSYDIIISSEEFNDLCVFINQWFWWKQGRHECIIQVESKEKFRISGNTFKFELNQTDIQNLRRNLEQIKDSFINEIRNGEDSFEPIPVQWNWINTRFY
jgi:hypothetical protein